MGRYFKCRTSAFHRNKLFPTPLVFPNDCNVIDISCTKVMHGVVVAERLLELMSHVMEVRTGRQLMYWSQMEQDILGHGAGAYGQQRCQCLRVS